MATETITSIFMWRPTSVGEKENSFFPSCQQALFLLVVSLEYISSLFKYGSMHKSPSLIWSMQCMYITHQQPTFPSTERMDFSIHWMGSVNNVPVQAANSEDSSS